jgi:DNA-binding NarL/FixJ family response regulator
MSTEMDQQQQQPKQQQIVWRRGRVLELSSRGRTERDIAAILQIGKTTVDRDLVLLRSKRKKI